jgi:hypothetical protein
VYYIFFAETSDLLIIDGIKPNHNPARGKVNLQCYWNRAGQQLDGLRSVKKLAGFMNS